MRANVANLVVVTQREADGHHALSTIEDLGAHVPSRFILLVAEPPQPDPSVRAWARVVERRLATGHEAVWEEVILQTDVHPRHLAAVVLPLLLSELPVFTWWLGIPPYGEPVFTELMAVTDRLVVDSGEFAMATRDLAALARHLPSLPATSDSTWSRIRPWRELIAGWFDGPPLRGCWNRVVQVVLDTADDAASLLLIGWLAHALDWELERIEPDDSGLQAIWQTPKGQCTVRLHATRGAGLRACSIKVRTDQGPATLRIRETTGELHVEADYPDRPREQRRVGGALSSGRHAIGGDLQRFGRDRVFEHAVTSAGAVADALLRAGMGD